ncbi:MAG: NifU family protein [Acidimicrobiales bacterium]
MNDDDNEFESSHEAPSLTSGPAGSELAISDDERASRRAHLSELVEVMSEAVREDGGNLVLVDANCETGVVEVELQGACGSCAISGITLQGGVERMLKERLPWVTEVRGGVDESLDFETSFAMGRGAYIPRA